MKRHTLCLVTSCFIFVVLLFPIKLLARPYYEGKVIKIIIGYEAGTGYDIVARFLAKSLPKHIPGKPTIIIENMAGGGSRVAANYLYNIAKPDGLTIATLDRALPLAQLLKAEGINFDMRRFSWIGSPVLSATVLCIRGDLPYKSFDDLRNAKSPIYVGASGPSATDYQFPLLLKEFLGVDFKMVNYPGATGSKLAVERKEVDAKAGGYNSLMPYIVKNMLRPLIRGRVSEPGIENLPVNEDLTTNKIGKILMSMMSVQDLTGRPFMAPPGTPTEIMEILRGAFAKVNEDPELKEESKKALGYEKLTYITSDECYKGINYIFNQPEDIVKECSKYIKF